MHAKLEVCIFSHFVTITFNTQKFMGSRDHGGMATPLFPEFFRGHVWIVHESTHAKFEVHSFALMELLAFNSQILQGHVTWPRPLSTVGGHQGTSFELWTAIIGPHMTSEKCFNTPIENALCRCQFAVKWGKNRAYPYWIFTPRKGTFVSGSTRLCQISSK